MAGNMRKNIVRAIDLNIAAVLIVGLLSFLLLTYSNHLWSNIIRRSVPLLDNLMQARISASEGHIWLEELIKGNKPISMEAVRESYRQAIEATDACLEGKSAIRGLPGLGFADTQLQDQFNRLKWSIKQSENFAEERWRNQGNVDSQSLMSHEHATAYHGGGLLAGAISAHLQEHISDMMKVQNNVFHLTLMVWGAILACVCATMMFYGYRQRKAERALHSSENRLHILSSHLLTAQEKERRRISLELHDELGQSLTVLKLQVRSVEKKLAHEQEAIRADCIIILNDINQIIENVRRLSRDLSPAILEDLGLTAAVRWLGENLERHAHITVALDMPDIDELFDRESMVTIYRIFQEAFNNIAKHSNAQHVSAQIQTSADEACFTIEDDGKGFKLSENPFERATEKGLGLTAMHERARMLGGELDISSRPGKGTRITFTVPLGKEGPHGFI
jgi:signal transduction histidine kinase